VTHSAGVMKGCLANSLKGKTCTPVGHFGIWTLTSYSKSSSWLHPSSTVEYLGVHFVAPESLHRIRNASITWSTGQHFLMTVFEGLLITGGVIEKGNPIPNRNTISVANDFRLDTRSARNKMEFIFCSFRDKKSIVSSCLLITDDYQFKRLLCKMQKLELVYKAYILNVEMRTMRWYAWEKMNKSNEITAWVTILYYRQKAFLDRVQTNYVESFTCD
jgi:hypothetical protein